MELKLVWGANFGCSRHCRTSPVVLEGFWGQVKPKLDKKPRQTKNSEYRIANEPLRLLTVSIPVATLAHLVAVPDPLAWTFATPHRHEPAIPADGEGPGFHADAPEQKSADAPEQNSEPKATGVSIQVSAI